MAALGRRFLIDLDHHLVPDPVGKAIACLVERIEIVEAGCATWAHRWPGNACTMKRH